MNPIRQILFVDDDENFLEGLRRMLHEQRHLWGLTFATTVEGALSAIEDESFDVVVTDVRMPDRNGFVLLKALRVRGDMRDVPVIMLTGDDDEELKGQALNLGATDLLRKPVSRADLVSRIQSAIRLKSAQDELKELNRTLEQRVSERTRDLTNAHRNIMWRLAKAGEYRDEETGNHVVRVGCYCRELAEAMGADSDFVERVFLTAPLHDIGKIGICDSILLKPGPLTDEERRIMQVHTLIGEEILLDPPLGMQAFLQWRSSGGPIPEFCDDNLFTQMAASVARSHHERWDGKGYPDGLAGHDIPVEARLAALGDVYDALCSRRPYKEPIAFDEVEHIIRESAGTHFDPMVYAAFEKLTDAFRDIRHEYADGHVEAAI